MTGIAGDAVSAHAAAASSPPRDQATPSPQGEQATPSSQPDQATSSPPRDQATPSSQGEPPPDPTQARPTARRATSQRTALRQVLAGTEEFVSAQELHTALRDSGTPVGLATVYRTLADLAAAGEVDTVRNPAGETLYRQCGEPAHHHHLVCRVCGRTEEVTSPGFETWARRVAQEYGFSDLDHEVELFGICADCAATHSG